MTSDFARALLGPLYKLTPDLLSRVMADTLEANTQFIEDLNRAQLWAGIDADGQPIEPDYTDATVRIKQAKGQPTDRVTLKDTGAVYEEIFTEIFSRAFEMDSSDPKAEELKAKYGPAIFGLNAASKQRLIDYIKPQFIYRLRAAIL